MNSHFLFHVRFTKQKRFRKGVINASKNRRLLGSIKDHPRRTVLSSFLGIHAP